MAGDWIKFECATSDKPEIWAIAAALDIDPDAVVGKLMRVWAWFDQQTTDGNAPSVTKALLNRLVGVTDFCQQVTLVGWMDDDGKTISLPNFDRHNGKTAKNRALTAKRVAKHKKGNATGNADTVTSSVKSALPREEKRREEKITNTTTTTGFAMTADWMPTPAADFDVAIINTGAVNSTKEWLNLLPEFVAYWSAKPETTSTEAGWQHRLIQSIVNRPNKQTRKRA